MYAELGPGDKVVVYVLLMQGDTESCVASHTCTTAEINQLAACPEGNLIAAADDDGYVTIIDPTSQEYNCQKLPGRHESICSSVLFQHHKPNQGRHQHRSQCIPRKIGGVAGFDGADVHDLSKAITGLFIGIGQLILACCNTGMHAAHKLNV